MNSNRAAVNILCGPFGMNTCYLNSLKSLSPPVLPPPPSPSTHPLHSFCFHSAACWEQESCEFRLYRLASICCRSWAAYWGLLLSCLHLFSKRAHIHAPVFRASPSLSDCFPQRQSWYELFCSLWHHVSRFDCPKHETCCTHVFVVGRFHCYSLELTAQPAILLLLSVMNCQEVAVTYINWRDFL